MVPNDVPNSPSPSRGSQSGDRWWVRWSDRGPTWAGQAAHATLIAVYAVLSASVIRRAVYDDWLGRDAEVYLRGSAAWLAGLDPWEAATLAPSGQLYHYAGLPPTVLAYAPLTLLPEWLGVGVILVIGALSAVYVLRRLGLPSWWLLFPPIVECLISGNPSLPILALLVSAAWPARALAPMLKVYALAPLLGERQWRTVALASCWLVATGILLFPLWLAYIAGAGAVSGRLFAESAGGFSGARDPLLFLAGGIGLSCLAGVRDWRAIGWLVVPALWPATQFHYSTLALPVIHPILAVGLAFPVNGLPPLAIAAYGIWRLFLRRWTRRPPTRHRPPPRSTGRLRRMSTEPRLSIVLPAYNEAERIGPALDELFGYLQRRGEQARDGALGAGRLPDAIEVLVVDDGCTDSTAAIVEARREATGDGPDGTTLRLLRVPHGGKGAAVKAGMLNATADLIVFADADMATPPDQLPLLVAGLADHDVSLGSRIQPDGSDMRATQPGHRRLLGKAFHLLASIWVVGPVKDTQCGFKGFTRAAARDLFTRQQISSIVFDVELIYLARRRGYRLAIVPVRWFDRRGSRMRARPRLALRVAWDLFRIPLIHRGSGRGGASRR